MLKAVLDTSFLITAVRWRIDFFAALAEWRLYLVPAVIDELNKIAAGRGRDAAAARIALELAERLGPQAVSGPADTALLQLAKEGWAIATQDRALRAKVKAAGARVIYIRQKKYVVVE